nr:hypothetical protein [Candidatus Sigynarchaeota archaeon]
MTTEDKDTRVDLDDILRQAITQDAVNEILFKFGAEKTIVNTEAANVARYANFRVQLFKHKKYILCPVPFFFDSERHIETGFALDVDIDYFVVLPYLQNYKLHKMLLLYSLPHCVHRGITVDAERYETISDEVKSTSNIASAMLFVTNLINDLAVGIDAPFEFFDSKLYLQLINRVLSVKDKRWVNPKIAEMRFKQLARQLDDLDPSNEFYENNRRRAMLSLAFFLFGFEDSIPNDGFFNHVTRDIIEPYALDILNYIVQSIESRNQHHIFSIENFIKLARYCTPSAIRPSIDAAFRIIMKEHQFEQGAALIDATGVRPGPEFARAVFKALYNQPDDLETVRVAEQVAKLTGIRPSEEFFRNLFQIDKFWFPQRKQAVFWINARFNELRVAKLAEMLSNKDIIGQYDGRARNIIILSIIDALFSWHIQPEKARTDDTPYVFKMLFSTGQEPAYVDDINVEPLAPHAHHIYAYLLSNNCIKEARQFHARIKIKPAIKEFQFHTIIKKSMAVLQGAREPRVDDVGDIIRNIAWLRDITGFKVIFDTGIAIHQFDRLLRACKIHEASILQALFGKTIPPIDEAVREAYEQAYLDYKFDDAALIEFLTGKKADASVIHMVYDVRLAQGLNDDLKELAKRTGILPNKKTVHEAFKTLFQQRKFQDASELRSWAGIAPDQRDVDKCFKELVAARDFTAAKDLLEASSRALGAETVQDVFRELVRLGRIADAQGFQRLSHARPEPRMIRSRLRVLVVDGRLDDARRISEWTGMMPEDYVVDDEMTTLLTQGHVHEARQLAEWTGRKPTKKILELVARVLEIDNDLDAVKSLKEWALE